MPLKIHSTLPILAVCLALQFAPTRADAATAPIVRDVSVVSQTADIPLDESFVRTHIATQVGMPLDRNVVSSDVRRLLDSKRFAYVGTTMEEVEGGVRVIYAVATRQRIVGKIVFEGLEGLRQSRVLEDLGLRSGDFADDQIANAAAERLRQMYVEKRYVEARVEAVLEPVLDNPGAVRLKFVIDEGKRSRINLIQFTGVTAIPERHLRRASGQSPWWNPSGWFSKVRVGDFDLEIMKADIRKQYLDKGYLDVKVSDPVKQKTGREWDIAFDIDEGALYRVGEIELRGITLFPETEVAKAIPLARNDVAGLAAIESARKCVRDFFSSRGYVDTRVQTATYPSDEPGTLNIVFTVEEAPLVSIRNILVRGNTSTRDKVVRREILLNPGEIYNGVLADRSQNRLRNLGYFADVRHYDLPVDPDTRDLVYEVEEQSTGSLMLGMGYSSVNHLIGLFEISQSNFDITNFRNFRGGGQKARLSIQAASDATDFEASFIEPWFLDRRLALEIDAFLRNRGYNEYDETRAGFSTGLSRHVPMIGRMGLAYTFQHVSLDDVLETPLHLADDPAVPFSYLDEDDGYLLGSLRLSWIYDTRNKPMVPTQGTRAIVHGTLYNAVFGSDYDFYEIDARFRNYQPLWYGHVLAFYLRASVVDSYGSDDIPIGNRYFLGGGRSVRGFRHRAVGPKASPDEPPGNTRYHPIGGQTRLEATIEYTIPLFTFLRMAAFYDIGNVWADPYDFDLGEYASSIGGGLRLDIPGFPMRIDYATALEKDDDLTRERRLVFWIGFDD
ncbi:MAG: outer membrane protein assembly factor BamA [Kiritimatiellia bacterium]|jgi:outer membrane protein insertion porin family